MRSYKETMLKTYVDRLNTPSFQNVDDLYKALLGIKAISGVWFWRKMLSWGCNRSMRLFWAGKAAGGGVKRIAISTSLRL